MHDVQNNVCIWKLYFLTDLLDLVWLAGVKTTPDSCVYMLSLFFFLFSDTVSDDISVWKSLQPNSGEWIFAGSTRVPGEGDFTPQITPPILTAIMLMPFTDLGKLQMVVLLVWGL